MKAFCPLYSFPRQDGREAQLRAFKKSGLARQGKGNGRLDGTPFSKTIATLVSWNSLEFTSLPIEGEGAAGNPAYCDVVKHTVILAASCALRLTE
jgi:hypothetical protein